ncbi:MAG: RluA family pseudouridine synthase [Pirellulaceae bacterium]|nr:RluA family pseudouridine synthase [Pirellulaceae bacterium]MDP7014688.1 RluA family pseudouridine synthase [Pirellulaceae bacterium]
MRLDAYLARELPQFSRTHLRKAINAAGVHVDGRRTKASHRLRAGEQLSVTVPDLPRDGPEPEEIPLSVIYEDEHLAAIDKPPGMVVHPSKGHWSGTLTAALAFRFQSQLSSVGGPARPGIVHRLDRDTSGVIVVAKSDSAHLQLAAQFEARRVEKEYLAIVVGSPDRDGDRIDQPIGAHPYRREKKAIRAGHATSRSAETFYEVIERFGGFALVRARPKTGRTHQIRLHLAHVGLPVLCDRLYGGRSTITGAELRRGATEAVSLDRQALHAHKLSLTHPASGQPIQFQAPVPGDLQRVLDLLRGDA